MPFDWFGDEVIKETNAAAVEAARQGAEGLLTNANISCPHDEGTLERSGTVTQGELPDANSVYQQAKDGKDMSGAFDYSETGEPVFFVSYNTPYAVPVHETDMNYRGKGEFKWLEKTAQRDKDKINETMGKIMKRELS